MTPTKLATVSAFALTLSAGAALAEAHTMMGDFDADADMSVTQDEFNTGLTNAGTFGSMDADASGTLTEDEYGMDTSGADYTAYDTDASGDISEEEFGTGVFGEYDADASGDLNEEEFTQVDTDMGEGGRFMMQDASMESEEMETEATTEGDAAMEEEATTEEGEEAVTE